MERGPTAKISFHLEADATSPGSSGALLPAASGHGGHLLTAAGVVDVWPPAASGAPGPAGQGEPGEQEGPQEHAASAEVKGQVVGLGPVKEPA